MIYLALLAVLVSSIKASGAPWYPFMVPIHTGGHQHRHTTHVVTHPIVHTRVLVLGDDEHHHNHQHNHGHNHLHKHGHGHKHNHHHKHAHQRHHSKFHVRHNAVHGRSNAHTLHHAPRQEARQKQVVFARQYDNSHEDEDYHGGQDYENHHGDYYNEPEPIKYSVPVHLSPWKPIHHFPKGYLPLKHLGIDEERVAQVVKDAMHEFDRETDGKSDPTLGVGIKSYRNPSSKSLTSFHRGAVYYDHPSQEGRHEDSSPGHSPHYFAQNDSLPPKDHKALTLNIECHCEDTHDA